MKKLEFQSIFSEF